MEQIKLVISEGLLFSGTFSFIDSAFRSYTNEECLGKEKNP